MRGGERATAKGYQSRGISCPRGVTNLNSERTKVAGYWGLAVFLSKPGPHSVIKAMVLKFRNA